MSSSDDTSTSSSYYYSSATTSTTGNETTGHRYTTTSHTDPEGNTVVRTAHQDLGEPATYEERRYDRTGQELISSRAGTGAGIDPSGGGGTRHIIQDMTDQDRNYDLSSTGAASVDTSNNQDLYALQDTSLSNFRPQDSSLAATNSPADDVVGSERHYRSDFDEGAVDPVTGKTYHPED